jgi:putative oxidoreductase
MQSIQRILAWLKAHRDLALDLIRFYLGIGLFVRGVLFIKNSELLTRMAYDNQSLDFVGASLVHFVAISHLVGGLMLAIGILTRLAAIVQLPILAGAVFVVHWHEGLLTRGQSLEFSALVLFLLVVFTCFGAGRYSIDHYISSQTE